MKHTHTHTHTHAILAREAHSGGFQGQNQVQVVEVSGRQISDCLDKNF